MRPIVLTALLLALGSCASNWKLREGAVLETDCELFLFYPDRDGDGWGDPEANAEALCRANAELQLTASNGRDCDDDPAGHGASITGLVGANCPDEVAWANPEEYAGVVFGESEYFFTWGEENAQSRFTQAEIGCELWSATDEAGDGTGGLATFDTTSDLNAVTEVIRASVGTEPFAAYVGIGWTGPIDADPATAWGWTDGTPSDNISALFTFCDDNQPPTPSAFYPNLALVDPEHAAGIADELPKLRIALVKRGNGFCLGTPFDAVDPTDTGLFTPGNLAEANLICERVKPLPEDFAEVAPEDAVPAGEGG